MRLTVCKKKTFTVRNEHLEGDPPYDTEIRWTSYMTVERSIKFIVERILWKKTVSVCGCILNRRVRSVIGLCKGGNSEL